MNFSSVPFAVNNPNPTPASRDLRLLFLEKANKRASREFVHGPVVYQAGPISGSQVDGLVTTTATFLREIRAVEFMITNVDRSRVWQVRDTKPIAVQCRYENLSFAVEMWDSFCCAIEDGYNFTRMQRAVDSIVMCAVIFYSLGRLRKFYLSIMHTVMINPSLTYWVSHP